MNRIPEFSSISPQEVLENNPLTFTVSATDPDGDNLTYSANNLPAGATFNASTRVFSWTPTTSQAGNYTVTFNATDDGSPVETGTLDVSITVGDNPTPSEKADDLVTTVANDPNISTSTENSYLANLQKVRVFIEDGKITAAINQLDAFIQKVNQDFQQEIITQQQKDTFLNLANDLKNDLQ